MSADQLQLAFHEVECHSYDARFGIAFDGALGNQVAGELSPLIGTARFRRVLDVGCGTGYLGLGLAAAGQAGELHLVDLSPGMLSRAGANAEALGLSAAFVQASAAALPYPDDSFDAVVSRGVLHHLHDVTSALAEWRRVVRRGGPVVVLSEPSPLADRVGGVAARATLAGLGAGRRIAAALGRPLSQHDEQALAEHQYWDLVAMAANLHTFTPSRLRELGRQAGFGEVRVHGTGAASIVWAVAYYVLAGQLPGLAGSPRARRFADRTWDLLRRVDRHALDRVLPHGARLTVQAVFRERP